jgi:two-component system chemotaxis sensor kinase CheA
MDDIFSVFAVEAREQLDAMESGLMQLEQGDRDPDTINGVFRAAHTIKGAAGVVEITVVEKFTHVLENVLDRLRNNEIQISGDMVSALLKGCDHIRALLDLSGGEPSADLTANGEAIAALLRGFAGQGEAAAPPKGGLPEQTTSAVERDADGTAMTDCWHISIRFGRDVLKNGMDPLAFLRYLLSLGEIVHITTLADSMPEAADMDPECCYLGFEINFRSHASKEQIENVFQFCRDECDLHILPPNSKIDDYMRLIETLPEELMRLGEILVKSGALTQEELDEGLVKQQRASVVAKETDQPAPQLGDILIQQKMVQPEIVEAAAVKQKQVGEKKAAEARLIRVQADKLDHLIDLVGELVIAGASANLLAAKSGQATLVEATSVLSRLVENIRDSALQLRMVQIGETFNRFHRVVRDTSKEIGKELELSIRGAETELDKTVVEKIGDPLMHLVRNAMDHGIESAELRAARGKSVTGHVGLNAFHDSGSIVIEVTDDGGGLPKEKIRNKAIEKGIITASQQLTDQEIANLIFEPGFSTADKVTNLSGRGVGMDVVRSNIRALRGTVEVHSEEGVGSRFTIRLPLTLAIIDGFLVGVDVASYVIPLDNVVECLELRPEQTRGNMLNLRGEVLPFIRLRDFFDVRSEPVKRENVVVVHALGQKAGIVVDVLQGEFQTVIKPLGGLFRQLRGIGGSTILGTGEVALILDVQALTQLASTHQHQAATAARASHLLISETE